ncbi:MAG: hypothetical protein ABIV21_05985, partial [Pyrinomonadaceae bacterium]
ADLLGEDSSRWMPNTVTPEEPALQAGAPAFPPVRSCRVIGPVEKGRTAFVSGWFLTLTVD